MVHEGMKGYLLQNGQLNAVSVGPIQWTSLSTHKVEINKPFPSPVQCLHF